MNQEQKLALPNKRSGQTANFNVETTQIYLNWVICPTHYIPMINARLGEFVLLIR